MGHDHSIDRMDETIASLDVSLHDISVIDLNADFSYFLTINYDVSGSNLNSDFTTFD